jgi:F-type H+-transporting ATPase subunit a
MSSETAPANMTEYIKHHLHHLQVQVPGTEGQFWLLNIDSIIFKLLACVLFVWVFLRVSRRATAGVPGKLQCAWSRWWSDLSMALVRETFHGRSKLIAPLSMTIFGLVFLMNFMDMLPVDFLPWAWAAGHEAAGHDPSHAYLRVVPTADINTTFGMSIAVFLLIQVRSASSTRASADSSRKWFTAPFHAEGTVMKILLALANLLLAHSSRKRVRPLSACRCDCSATCTQAS